MASKEKKSRRRLQIDPEEYAPPTSLYDVSASPRPDAEWLKFYGGASEGAPKSLSSLDDEDDSTQAVSTLPHLESTDLRSPTPPPLPQHRPTLRDDSAAGETLPSEKMVRSGLREINPKQAPSQAPPQAPSAALPFPSQQKTEVLQPQAPLTSPATQSRATALEEYVPAPAPPRPTRADEHQEQISFKEFTARWRGLLTFGVHTGKLRICEVLFKNTYAINQETYFTSLEKLSKEARLDKRTCHINILQLEKIGFIERLAVFNTATKKGTAFKLHLSPLEAEMRKRPSRYLYEEDSSDTLL